MVIGHFLDLPSLAAPDSPARVAIFWIYFLHMPAMALISGYFAKGLPILRDWRKLAVRTLAPYLVFQVAYLGALGKPLLGLLEPAHLTWYLISLFSWQLLLPLAARIRRPAVGLAVAFVVALLAGYVPGIGMVLSLSRTLTFFPFFLAGFYLQPGHLEQLRARRREATLALSILLMVALVAAPLLNPVWLNFADSYGSLGRPEWWAGGIRLFLYSAAVVATGSFLALVPVHATFFTAMGGRTMYVYLGHGLALIGLREVGLDAWAASAVLCVGVGVAIVLGTEAVQRAARPVVEPFWLLDLGLEGRR